MTCIVGLEHEGGVTIGGDSAGVAGWALTIRADEKVFRRGSYLMGFTTSFRMGQLLRYAGEDLPDPDGVRDFDAFMATEFVDAVRKILKDGGWAKVENSREEGGAFLVGVRGRLYGVHDDFQVSRSAAGFSAVGCGGEIAVGSLHTSDHAVLVAPHARVTWALEAAAALSAGVAEPFTILTLEAVSC